MENIKICETCTQRTTKKKTANSARSAYQHEIMQNLRAVATTRTTTKIIKINLLRLTIRRA